MIGYKEIYKEDILMRKRILKRHGNYILRIREIKGDRIIYSWHYSKELNNIIKKYGTIEQWQFNQIEDSLNIQYYCYIISDLNKYYSLKNRFKATEDWCIKHLLQFSNGVGIYAKKILN